MAEYEVLELSFINGRLCQPGEVVQLEIDSPGSNLRLVKRAKGSATTVPAPTGAAFVAYHIGAGKFGVKDGEGERVGEFSGSKDEANAEAERLIAEQEQAAGHPDA